MKQSPVYLDHNATTPIDSGVLERLPEWLSAWGNPSSIHQFGREPKKLMREARRKIARLLGIHPLELVFTATGSEANNLALSGCLEALRVKGDLRRKIIVSPYEHPSTYQTLNSWKTKGYEVVVLSGRPQGSIDIEEFQRELDENTALVSVMAANNETGVLYPIEKLVKWTHLQGAYFHCDGVQALGKINFSIEKWGVDFLSFSSHKIYALKGAGGLFVRRGTPLSPVILGGAQERQRRAGTENVAAISSMAYMVETLYSAGTKYEFINSLRNDMEALVIKNITDVKIWGSEEPRLPNTSAMTFADVSGEVLMMNLDIKGYGVSTGAACSSGNPEPSATLMAMGLTREEAQSSLRVSLGRSTTREQIENFVEILQETVQHLRSLAGREACHHG